MSSSITEAQASELLSLPIVATYDSGGTQTPVGRAEAAVRQLVCDSSSKWYTHPQVLHVIHLLARQCVTLYVSVCVCVCLCVCVCVCVCVSVSVQAVGSEALQAIVVEAAERYVATPNGCPVARFHQSHGAVPGRVNWLANVSPKVLFWSCCHFSEFALLNQ